MRGDSVAVNGACLTVKECRNKTFVLDVSAETLRCTTLGMLNEGDSVNLEHALRVGDMINGHFVSGHIDGVGTVFSCVQEGGSMRVEIEAPETIIPLIAVKGSISVDGVSLTVNAIHKTIFQVNIIPYTLENTILSSYKKGRAVNLEADLIARYLARQLVD